MASLKGKRIVLTGAASGIGRCAAKEFARAGCELIITDINEELLKETTEELRERGASVRSYVVDVSRREQVEEMAESVINSYDGIDILINNAGIGHSGEIVETTLETWERLMAINFWGPLYHVYAFLPSMIERGSGHIVNVSSGQAFFRLPTWGAYSTVKLALGAFSEILRFELRKFDIQVTTFYPFMVNTPFYGDIEGETFFQRLSMKMMPYYSMSPERVGKILFKAVKKRKAIEMVSVINDIGKLTRFVPKVADIVGMASIMALGKSADDLRQYVLYGQPDDLNAKTK